MQLTNLILSLSVVAVGYMYTHREFNAMWQCITEQEYISLEQFNKIRRTNGRAR